MIVRTIWIGMALASLAGTARANDMIHGAYICTVEQKSGIAAEQSEGADPPKAFIDKRVTRFRIAVTPPAKSAKTKATFHVEETPYAGPNRDTQTWQTKNSVLHGTYRGDGWKFTAVKDQAFLRLDFIGEAGWLWFYHAGFEQADVDHLSLSIRSGPCEPDK
ncbi:MAG: hypothetical protein ABL996_06340 [Micropepsaceae bacterium]|mgnify:CR=1 FL=1